LCFPSIEPSFITLNLRSNLRTVDFSYPLNRTNGEGECGVFPLESVLVTIEVKSSVTAADLKNTDAAARELSRFRYAPPVQTGFWDDSHEIEGVVPYLLAFDSDLQPGGLSACQRYDQNRDESMAPGVRGLCVAGRGFWFWHNEWNQWPEIGIGAEIVNVRGGGCTQQFATDAEALNFSQAKVLAR
jgi:hypothetical protein